MTTPESAMSGAPGKVVAVHLSYRSRADERGREPAFASYFLKPSTSVGRSGAGVPMVVHPTGSTVTSTRLS